MYIVTATMQDVCLREEVSFTVCMGMHCVKHGSNLQSAISLSSGESAYYALVKASAIGMILTALS